MAPESKSDIIGLIAIIVGGMLAMGGLMFLLALSFMEDMPTILLIPPLLQIALGSAASVSGIFLRRGHTAAKSILVLVAIGVVANWLFLMGVFVFLATRN